MQLAQLDFYQAAQEQNLPGVTPGVLNSSDRGFGDFLSNILSGVMVVSALMLLLYLLWGAIDWITSGGDSSKVQKARDKMTQAVIGILVLASALTIFMIVQSFLGIEFFRLTGGSGGSKDTGGKTLPAIPTSVPVQGVPVPQNPRQTLQPSSVDGIGTSPNSDNPLEALENAIQNEGNPELQEGSASNNSEPANGEFQEGSANNSN